MNETKLKYNIPDGASDKHLQLLVDIEYDLYPSLSAREFIFKYLSDHRIYNKKIKDFVNRQLKRNDYFTDDEIRTAPMKYIKISNLRNVYDYGESYEKMNSLLKEIHEDKPTIKCRYCGKYVMNMKKHYNKCLDAMLEFYKNKERFISDYINLFYNPIKLKDNEVFDASFYFSHYNYKTFTGNIGIYLRSHKTAINRIEKKQEEIKNKKIKEDIKEKKMERFNPKKFVSDFIEEFDKEWVKETQNDIETTVEDKNELNTSIEKIIENGNSNRVLVNVTPTKKKSKEIPNNSNDIPKLKFEISAEGVDFLKNNIGCNAGKRKRINFIINNPFKK
jgi:hypothetical protein